jgi:hypothetical protein
MTGRAKDFQDDELVGVDPRRRALVRKRLQIVRRYLALRNWASPRPRSSFW